MLAHVTSVRRVSQQLVMCALLPNFSELFRGEDSKAARAVWGKRENLGYQYPEYPLCNLLPDFAIAACFKTPAASPHPHGSSKI